MIADRFNIWRYPIFCGSLAYVWLELVNPVLAVNFQVITSVPNSAIATLIAYFSMPEMLSTMKIRDKVVNWTLPFLLLATINIPFVMKSQDSTIKEMISLWFWVIFLLPLMIRVLITKSGRYHFVLFSTISIAILSVYFLIAFNSNNFRVGLVGINRHHLAAATIFHFPIIYHCYKNHHNIGFRMTMIICLIIILGVTLVSGARSAWLILPFQFLLYSKNLGHLSISKLVITLSLAIPLFTGVIIHLISEDGRESFNKRVEEAENWREDRTLLVRLAMWPKALHILRERPILGAGINNRNFANFPTSTYIEILGEEIQVNGIDAHNTYLNIIAGTGFLGVLAYIYFFRKVYRRYKSLLKSHYLPGIFSSFLVSIYGTLLWYVINTHSFAHQIQLVAMIVAMSTYQEYIKKQSLNMEQAII